MLLVLCFYVLAHYLFPGNPAHVSALFTVALETMVALGAPAKLASLCLFYFSNIMGCTSTYGMANAVIYFGEGYVKVGKAMLVGGILCVVHSVIWIVAGGTWWKVLGYW